MLEIHRTHQAKICNHSQVAEPLDRHGWSASKLWNVANYHARQVWDETGEIRVGTLVTHEKIGIHTRLPIHSDVIQLSHALTERQYRDLSPLIWFRGV